MDRYTETAYAVVDEWLSKTILDLETSEIAHLAGHIAHCIREQAEAFDREANRLRKSVRPAIDALLADATEEE